MKEQNRGYTIVRADLVPQTRRCRRARYKLCHGMGGMDFQQVSGLYFAWVKLLELKAPPCRGTANHAQHSCDSSYPMLRKHDYAMPSRSCRVCPEFISSFFVTFEAQIFPAFTYDARTDSLVDETPVTRKAFSGLLVGVAWGVAVAIFVEPLGIGVVSLDNVFYVSPKSH